MIYRTAQALGLGLKAGWKVTSWVMRKDIEKAKELLDKTPILKDVEFHNPITINKDKGGK